MPLERCAPRIAVQKEPAGLVSEKLGERDCSWPKWNTEYRIAGSIPLSLELLCTSPSFYPFNSEHTSRCVPTIKQEVPYQTLLQTSKPHQMSYSLIEMLLHLRPSEYTRLCRSRPTFFNYYSLSPFLFLNEDSSS